MIYNHTNTEAHEMRLNLERLRNREHAQHTALEPLAAIYRQYKHDHAVNHIGWLEWLAICADKWELYTALKQAAKAVGDTDGAST
jgi:ATP-dependent helicase/DNAse subunit B